ncbi:hypothetical protein [Paenirhodobacter populi]|uniref:hypothetical protein n=1 Tax=Paenirhodobacter populi TaxID=2306993 RepID=UPI0013E32259|nr:hypothetical protein [Sinirhodobacter populi]
MAEWVRHPPSKRRVMIAAIVLAIAVAIVAADGLGLWPEWAHMTRPPRTPAGY